MSPASKERNPSLQRIRRLTRLLLTTIVGLCIFAGIIFGVFIPTPGRSAEPTPFLIWALLLIVLCAFLVGVLYFTTRLMQMIGAYRFSLRKQTTHQIARTENKYKILIQNSQDLITIINAKGTINYQSPSSLQVLGYAAEELEGKNIYDLIHDDDACLLENAVESSHVNRFQLRLQRHDGKWRHFECTRTDLRENTLIVGLVVNLHDITEFKREEEKRIEKEFAARSYQHEAQVEKERAEYEKRQKEIIEAKNIELEIANETIQAQNQKITDGLYYAKTIQNALLPGPDLIVSYLPDSFMLLKPKEIVSGDFYWFTAKEDCLIFTMADCTGHGVPGALMTMIGNTLLNQIVIENDVTDPSKILYHLNIGVRKALRQAERSGQIDSRMDGMDVAVLRIEPQNKQILFAGANQPLFMVRNGEWIEYSSEKKSVGGKQKEAKRLYESQRIGYEIGDCIYLATDGAVDQFNSDGKKFMQHRLKETILASWKEKMEVQSQRLDHRLMDWMDDYEQIDDILVAGIRL